MLFRSSVNYHRRVYVSVRPNQWLALTMLGSTGPCFALSKRSFASNIYQKKEQNKEALTRSLTNFRYSLLNVNCLNSDIEMKGVIRLAVLDSNVSLLSQVAENRCSQEFGRMDIKSI